jgi:hypothetical protein
MECYFFEILGCGSRAFFYLLEILGSSPRMTIWGEMTTGERVFWCTLAVILMLDTRISKYNLSINKVFKYDFKFWIT